MAGGWERRVRPYIDFVSGENTDKIPDWFTAQREEIDCPFCGRKGYAWKQEYAPATWNQCHHSIIADENGMMDADHCKMGYLVWPLFSGEEEPHIEDWGLGQRFIKNIPSRDRLPEHLWQYLNGEGKRKGLATCLICDDSWFWKLPHHIKPLKGYAGPFPYCEECNQQFGRFRHIQAMLRLWREWLACCYRESLRSVEYRRVTRTTLNAVLGIMAHGG